MGWRMADLDDDILRFVDYIPVCPFSYLLNAIFAILPASPLWLYIICVSITYAETKITKIFRWWKEKYPSRLNTHIRNIHACLMPFNIIQRSSYIFLSILLPFTFSSFPIRIFRWHVYFCYAFTISLTHP